MAGPSHHKLSGWVVPVGPGLAVRAEAPPEPEAVGAAGVAAQGDGPIWV